MKDEYLSWIIFIILVSVLLTIDIVITERRSTKISFKSSLIWSGVWIFTAFLFCGYIYISHPDGNIKSIEFISGYLIEKSLSIDNLFVFLTIFNIMKVSDINQPHVLKWGILSAIIFRIIFIIAGIGLINLFRPIIYIFGIILFLAAYKMAFPSKNKINFENNIVIKFIRRHFNLNSEYQGKNFFLRDKNKLYITSMFLTFLLIESSDIIFAVDSIPAIIAITRDTFIIITSNILAILGLRTLYFAISGLADLFYYLKYGVSLILFFMGIKIVISEYYKISGLTSLLIILTILIISILFSIYKKQKIYSRKEK